jgi:hypothetical protein
VRLVPAVSAPDPCDDSSLCGMLASSIVLVQANDVTIEGLTLDGDNPALTSGVVVGGADVDARNGVIVNYLAGTFDGLVVSDVTVKNVYFRGIYAASGGTFAFTGDTVSNVSGDPAASVAIFNFGGAGVMSNNVVEDASDSIASNWSTGTVYDHNRVIGSRSGIHTDNNGGLGGDADVIEDNEVLGCPADGMGIYVFAPDVQPTVENNLVRGCAVGLALFGGGAKATRFDHNVLDGLGAATIARSGTTGILVTTDLLGYGYEEARALVTSTSVTGFGTGVHVEVPGGEEAHAVLRENAIAGNRVGAVAAPGASADAILNWWGCPTGPDTRGCETVVGAVAYRPWLRSPPLP